MGAGGKPKPRYVAYANDTTESDSDNDEAGVPTTAGPSAWPSAAASSSADSPPTCLLCALPIDGADAHLVPDALTGGRQPVHDSCSEKASEMIIGWNGAWEASCFMCHVRQKMDFKTGLMRCACLRCPNCNEPIAEYTAETPYLITDDKIDEAFIANLQGLGECGFVETGSPEDPVRTITSWCRRAPK